MAEEREAPTRVIPCELCDSEAELHCAADSAFLCRSCDSKIHSSNFLAARHLRRFLCPICKSLTGNNISGAVIPPQSHGNIPYSCSSILPSDTHRPSCLSSRCSSLESVQTSELSSTAEAKNLTARRNRRRDGCVRVQGRNRGHGEVDGIFLNWCKILGVKGRSLDSVVSTASLALSVLMEKPVRILPYRVSLTASFWFGIRVAREAMMTWQNLRRLQEISGVPGKTIMQVEMRISRAMRWWSVDLREGWAETEGAWAES